MTIGSHVAFAPGAYDPHSPAGMQLIGHELVHSVQQSRGCGPDGAPRVAAETEADRLSTRAVGGQPVNVTLRTGIAPAFSLQDYQQTIPGGFDEHIKGLSVSQLQTDIAEISEYLDAQFAGNETTDRLFAVRDQLRARLDALLRTVNSEPAKGKPAKGKGKGKKTPAAPTLEPVTIDQVPRSLRERRSTSLDDPEEVKHEVDLIVAYLQRPDITKDERAILRVELQVLAPQFDQALQTDASTRQAKRVQAVFADAGEGADGLRKKIAIIEAIYDDPSEPLAAFIQAGNERVRISKVQARQLRANAVENLRSALRRAQNSVDNAEGLYTIQSDINDDHPVVSRISGWLGGVDNPGMALAIAKGVHAAYAKRAGAALDSGNLSGAVEPLVGASTQARKIEMAVYAWHSGLIEGAEAAITGLTFVRDAAFAIDIAIASVVAAPFVAGVVAGTGATGTLATGLTIAGSSALVGTSAATVGGASEYTGQRIAGASHQEAAGEAWKMAKRRGIEGAASALGGGTTNAVAKGLNATRLAASPLAVRAISQGTGNFVGGTSQALMEGRGLTDSVKVGGISSGIGLLGNVAGAPLGDSPLARMAVEGSVNVGAGYFYARSQGASEKDALTAAAVSLSTMAVTHNLPSVQKDPARYEAKGRQVGAQLKSTAVSAKNKVGSAARATMLGLQLSLPPARASNGSGMVPAFPSTITAEQTGNGAPAVPGIQEQTAPAATQQAPAQNRVSTVAANVEAEMGIPAAQRTALKGVFSGNLTSPANAALGNVWARVANRGEAATLTAANSRRLFSNHRNRFWRAVRSDPAALQTIRDMGGIFPEERNGGTLDPTAQTIPEINLPDGTRLGISIDHQIERQTNPSLALSLINLRLSTIRENTVMLRQLHKRDPFNNPPPGWIPGP